MADETPEKPRRRRRKPAEADAPAAEAATAPQAEAAADDEAMRAASSADASAESAPDEIEPTPADVEAADEAADVVLEAEAEIDEDSEAEAEAEPEPAKPARRARRRRGAEEAKAEEPPKPAPRRRRPARDPSLPPPVVRAQAKYVRSSPRKARLVCDHIRGKSVEEARAILAHTPRAVARDWSKLLESAIANAENNHELVGEDLYVKAIHADVGPTIKRFRPRALGRATKIRKRTSHLTILLTPKE
jgi:large subunit ribosomal protein L22